jgi:predicted SprT family Zn-dependent metalloprotease
MTENTDKGCVKVQLNLDESATCNFCRDRDPAKFRLSSTDRGRNLVVYFCQSCADHLKQMIS